MSKARISESLRVPALVWSTAFALTAAPVLAQEQASPEGPAPAPPASQAEQDPPFDIEAYDVEGATLLDQVTVETAVYPFLGPQRRGADVDKAREALEKAYHSRGYQSVVVEIPAQSVDTGVIRLSVLETPVGRVRVEGSRYFSPGEIRRLTPSLAAGTTPNLIQTQKEIGDLNRLADRRVTPILKAGKIPGTVDIDLKVSDTLPLHATVELNNDHAQGTSPLRASATVRYTNLWQAGHTVSSTYLVAPENYKDAQVFAASYLAPLWGSSWSLLGFGYTSNSDIASLGGTSVLGNGFSVGVRAIYQLPQWGEISHSVNFGVDYKNFDEAIRLGSAEVEAPIEYLPLVAAYSAQRATEGSSTNVSLSVTAGLRGIGSDPFDFENKRAYATGSFVHLNVEADHTQNLPYGFSAFARWSSQLTDQPLVSAEQFSAGGLNTVRGYLQSEAVGDNGILGSLELRSPSLSPYLGALAERYLDDWRIYTFIDAAKAWVLQPLPDQDPRFTLIGAGVGTRVQLFRYFYGDVLVGVPLMDAPATQAGEPFVSFSVKTEF